jgi:hypothetical protein
MICSGRDDATKADRSVSDHRCGLTGGVPRHHGGMMSGAHDVRECQQRRYQGIVGTDLQGKQRAVGLRALHAGVSEENAMKASGVQVLVAEHTGAVENANGMITRSPFLTALTEEPVASTTPMASWPMR